MAATIEGQERVMATAQQILKSLNAGKDATDDMITIFSTFDNRLKKISTLMSDSDSQNDVVSSRFESAEKVILQCDNSSESSRHSTPWEEESADYLAAVDEILQFLGDLNSEENDVVDRAEVAIQVAMGRLEDEFRHVLIRNTVPLDAESLRGSIRRGSLSFASTEGGVIDFESFGEDIDRKSFCHERGLSLGDDICVDLILPEAVDELREIADRMIRSGYEKECCQVYSSIRRDVLDECLSILGVEKLSIEEVQKIEWNSLDEKMKKWCQSVKIVFRVLLPGEKRICEQIFGSSETIKEVCFVETSKGCVIQLLNFGEAVVIAKRSSEKLFRILDMYEALASISPELESLFNEESGELVCSEARGVLDGLGVAAIGTFVEFENAVQGESSRKPIQGAEIHPLTRYVMNYVRLLVDYSESLNKLLETISDENDDLHCDNLALEDMSPIGRRLLTLIKSLESNLEEKSRMYEDPAMQYVFLMNNILYIVQKVKDSELAKLLGDHWVRKHRGQVRQYATSYLRAAWSKVLLCLKDEGISGGSSSNNASRTILKERFKNFNAHFEEIYRAQTAWKVPDAQLREELRISISEKVLPAYRSFMGRFGNHLESSRHAGKYIKYYPEDLENYLSDLFEGTPGVLHLSRRKST